MSVGSIATIAALVTVLSFLVVAVVAVVNRGIREDRITHLTGLVENLQTGLNNERATVRELTDRIANLEGQIVAVTGEVGQRINNAVVAGAAEVGEQVGQRIADAIFKRLDGVR